MEKTLDNYGPSVKFFFLLFSCKVFSLQSGLGLYFFFSVHVKPFSSFFSASFLIFSFSIFGRNVTIFAVFKDETHQKH